jgi:DNA polymerase-3 subunit beta
MKFACERDDLLEAVQFASRAISNRATLPVLSGLKIEAGDGDEVAIAATDLELTMGTTFHAGVDEPGRVIVPGRLLGEMSRSLAPGRVSLASGDAEVEIGSGRGRFHVKALSPEDYPALPLENHTAGDADVVIEVAGVALAMALSQVVRSASGDESRQVLTGVLWEIEQGRLTLAATDSYRLAIKEVEVGVDEGVARRVVLPARTLGELARALQGVETVVTEIRENLIVFLVRPRDDSSGSRAVIGSRYIEGEFPKYRQLIPSGYSNTLSVERDALLEVVRRVGLLAQNNMPIKLNLGSELEISAHTPDVGEGQEVVDAIYEGEPFVIAFNPQFLSDGGAAIQTERVVLQAGDGLKPAILHGEGDESFTYLLMPVRLS